MNPDGPILIDIRNPVVSAGEWSAPFLGKMMAMMLVGIQHRSMGAKTEFVTIPASPLLLEHSFPSS